MSESQNIQSDRREFLKRGGSLALAALLPGWTLKALAEDQPKSYICGGYQEGNEGVLFFWSPGDNSVESLKLPFYPHSVERNPADPDIGFAFSKFRAHAAIIDLKKRVLLRQIRSEPSCLFTGHGVVSRDGRLLFCAEQDEATLSGLLVVRDTRTFKILERISTYSTLPHEVRWDEDRETLVVANFTNDPKSQKPSQTGKDYSPHSNISWISSRNGHLIKRVEFDTPHSVSHFCTDKQGWIVCGGMLEDHSSDGKSMVATISPSRQVSLLQAPPELASDFKGECASIAIDEETGLVAACPRSSTHVYLWNYRNGQYRGSAHFKQPHAVTWSKQKRKLLVAENSNMELRSLDPGSISSERLQKLALQRGRYAIGPHLIHLDL